MSRGHIDDACPRIQSGTLLFSSSPFSTIVNDGDVVVAAGSALAPGKSSLLQLSVNGDSQAVESLATANIVDAAVTALCVVPGGNFVVASHGDQNLVVLHSLPELARHRTLMTCPLAVRSLAVSKDFLLAVSSDDGLTRIMDIGALVREGGNPDDDSTLPSREFKSPSGYVKTTCFDPLCKYLAFGCRDGSVTVYSDYAPSSGSGTPKLAKKLQNLRAADDLSPGASTIGYPVIWHPSGEVLVAGTDKGVKVFLRDSWECIYNMASLTAGGPLGGAHYGLDAWTGTNALAWSPNGRYLAAVDGRRLLSVWDFTVGGTRPMPGSSGNAHVNAASNGRYTEVCQPVHVYIPMLKPSSAAEGESQASQYDAPAATQPFTGSGSAESDSNDTYDRLDASSDRITGFVWCTGGKAGAFIGTSGVAGGVDLALLVASGDPANAPDADLDEPLQFPLPFHGKEGEEVSAAGFNSGMPASSAPAASTFMDEDDDDDGSDMLRGYEEQRKAEEEAKKKKAAEEAAAAKKQSASKKAGGKKKGSKYVDGQAMEADGDEEEEEDDDDENDEAEEAKKAAAELAEKEAAKAKAAAKPAASSKDKDKGKDGDDNDSVVDLGALKRKHGFVDADDDGEDGLGGLRRIDEPLEGATPAGDDVDDDDNGDDGGRGARGGGRGVDLEAAAKLSAHYVHDIYGMVAPQQAFQPNATAGTSNASGTKRSRYLCWNAVGAIVRREDGMDATLSFDFTDASRFRSRVEDDHHGYSLAALNEHGYILASPYRPPQSSAAGEGPANPGRGVDVTGQEYDLAAYDGKASRLYYKALDGFGEPNTLTWSLELPVGSPRMPEHAFSRVPGSARDDDDEDDEDAEEGAAKKPVRPRDTSEAAESALAVAVGDGWAACVTDHQNLRFIRSGGLQDLPFAVPGAPVTVVGRGAICAVIYHRAAPSNYRQNMAADVYLFRSGVDAAGSTALPRKIASAIDVPMRPHRLLRWACIAPNGMLVTQDSDGIVMATCAALEWSWTNIADTKHAAAHPELLGREAPPESSSSSSSSSGSKPFTSRDTRDCFWPVDITFSDPSVAAASGYDVLGKEGATVRIPFKTVPMLQAVLCKGGKVIEPAVSNPRPLTSYIPLRMGIVDSAGGRSSFATTVRMDEMYLRHELYRLQRGWMVACGLDPQSGDSLTTAVANRVASGIQRGEAVSDASTIIQKTVNAEVTDSSKYANELDKIVVIELDSILSEGRDFRGSQLAARLHVDRSFAIAMKVAGQHNSAGAAERLNQNLAVRQALATGLVQLPAPEVGHNANLASGANAVGAFVEPAPAHLDAAALAAAGGSRGGAAGAAASSSGAGAGFGLAARAKAAAAAPAPAAAPVSATAEALAHLGGPTSSSSLHEARAAPAPASRQAAGAAAAAAASRAGGAGSRGGGGGGFNPFAANKVVPANGGSAAPAAGDSGAAAANGSPARGGKRARDGLDALASPQRPAGGAGGGAGLNRQSSLAQEARERESLKRARKE